MCDRGDVSVTNRVWLCAACAVSVLCKFQLIYGHIGCLLTLALLKFWERKRCLFICVFVVWRLLLQLTIIVLTRCSPEEDFGDILEVSSVIKTLN